jgi:carbamoyl-phosphate synthase small subunit
MNAPDVNVAATAALFPPTMPALLALADGTVFRGQAIGADGHRRRRSRVQHRDDGYQEILTDPSYAGQIVTLTYPHIGNVGVNDEDVESKRISRGARDSRSAAARLELAVATDLATYLRDGKIVGIRRHRYAQAHPHPARARRARTDASSRPASMTRRRPAPLPGAGGSVDGGPRSREGRLLHYAVRVDVRHVVARRRLSSDGRARFHVVAYDYGVKHNILRMLAERGCRMTVVPAQMPAREVLAMKPDGVFLSNGPGDPEPCDYAIAAIREIIASGMPVFGICLGHQLLGLAAGGRTLKMKFGHHGANHPVLDRDTGQVLITSQNHGFAVDPASLPANVRVTHVSLFDGSLQGLRVDRQAGVLLPGTPRGKPGAARPWLSVRIAS